MKHKYLELLDAVLSVKANQGYFFDIDFSTRYGIDFTLYVFSKDEGLFDSLCFDDDNTLDLNFRKAFLFLEQYSNYQPK